MEIRKIFTVSRKTFFNPRGWLGYDQLKGQHQEIKTVVKGILTPDKPTREETFEEAMVRLDLTEADVTQRIKTYKHYAYFFCLLGAISFFYTFHILFLYRTITPWLMGMGMSALFFSQAFKYHFWAFQMQSRRLGVSITEWKNSLLGIKSTHP